MDLHSYVSVHINLSAEINRRDERGGRAKIWPTDGLLLVSDQSLIVYL